MKTENKIGIVTLHGYYNYGNNLQNYALKYLLEKLGFEVSTTIVSQPPRKLTTKLKEMSIEQLSKFLSSKLDFIKFIRNKKNETLINEREKKFKNFSSKYLSEKFYSLSNIDDVKKLEIYSFFVTGSDQVWNPIYYANLPTYFLTFVEKNKRIAYAPSISREKLPEKYLSDYERWLKGMESISVREEAGAKIIKKLTGLDVPVLVDPTMLLTKEEWLSISNRAPNRPDSPYLLTYFLGGPSDETRKKLEELAERENMEIVNLGDITEKETYKTGPSEFLDYINNADAFFTDSFHGVVFSIIFQTPFIVYERFTSGPSMYSRIETLLDNFGLKNRENTNFSEDIFAMDFSGTDEVLEKEYTKSLEYLQKVLK